MAETPTTTDEPEPLGPEPRESGRQRFSEFPRWKKILVVGAGLLVVVGLVLIPFEGSGSSLRGSGGDPLPEGASSLVGGGTGDTTGVTEGGSDLSPAFLRLGFSFFVGFAIGYAFRSFLKLALIVIGIQLIALFALEYAQWISVNWDQMGGFFDGFVERVKNEADAFKTFVTGSLPQAGLALLGLYAGFRKR